MPVSFQGCDLSLVPVPLPLGLVLNASQSTPSLMELFLQTGALRSTRGWSIGGRLVFLVFMGDQ